TRTRAGQNKPPSRPPAAIDASGTTRGVPSDSYISILASRRPFDLVSCIVGAALESIREWARLLKCRAVSVELRRADALYVREIGGGRRRLVDRNRSHAAVPGNDAATFRTPRIPFRSAADAVPLPSGTAIDFEYAGQTRSFRICAERTLG